MASAKIGRPPLPAKKRRSARVTVRLDAADELQLARLRRALELDDSEVVRRALAALAAAVLKD